jgi:pseudouridine-5'-phosphate glycosidase
VLRAKQELGLEGGAVICNPIDAADEIAATEMAGFIDRAVGEAARRGVAGKAVTPHILALLVELTGGRSLRANIALVKSNARLAGEIAGELSSPGQAGRPTPLPNRLKFP